MQKAPRSQSDRGAFLFWDDVASLPILSVFDEVVDDFGFSQG